MKFCEAWKFLNHRINIIKVIIRKTILRKVSNTDKIKEMNTISVVVYEWMKT